MAKPNPQGSITYVIVHRGTELSKSNDWDDAGYLGLEKSPDQAVDALAFASKIYQKAGPRDEVINTGHSLGGALATFSHVDLTQAAYGRGESHLWAVAFESPGVEKSLLKKGYSPDVVAAAKEKIDILNTFPNAINTAGTHFVTPFAVVTPNNVAGELGAVSYVRDSFMKWHPIKNLKEALYGDAHDNPNVTVLHQPWPQGFHAGYEHYADYINNPQAWDRYHESLKRETLLGAGVNLMADHNLQAWQLERIEDGCESVGLLFSHAQRYQLAMTRGEMVRQMGAAYQKEMQKLIEACLDEKKTMNERHEKMASDKKAEIESAREATCKDFIDAEKARFESTQCGLGHPNLVSSTCVEFHHRPYNPQAIASGASCAKWRYVCEKNVECPAHVREESEKIWAQFHDDMVSRVANDDRLFNARCGLGSSEDDRVGSAYLLLREKWMQKVAAVYL